MSRGRLLTCQLPTGTVHPASDATGSGPVPSGMAAPSPLSTRKACRRRPGLRQAGPGASPAAIGTPILAVNGVAARQKPHPSVGTPGSRTHPWGSNHCQTASQPSHFGSTGPPHPFRWIWAKPGQWPAARPTSRLGWPRLCAQDPLHGHRDRHLSQPSHPRFLHASMRQGQTQEGGSRSGHAQAAHRSERGEPGPGALANGILVNDDPYLTNNTVAAASGDHSQEQHHGSVQADRMEQQLPAQGPVKVECNCPA